MNIAFIGLGNMGAPMARNLLAAGHTVSLWNRTREHAAPLADDGARVADDAASACREAELVVSMLGNDTAVEEVVLAADGILPQLRKGTVHACMSTISVALGRRLTEAHERAACGYVSAPVFGRPDAAAAAKLWIMAAGKPAHIERCRPAFEAMSQRVFEIGDDPAGANVVKIAGNLMLAAAIEAMGETFALVRKHGVDPALFHEILTSTLFGAPIYHGYGKLILSGVFEPAGFRLENGLKDASLALRAGDDSATPLPLASLLRDHYLSAVASGWKDLDWAAISKVIARDAGLPT